MSDTVKIDRKLRWAQNAIETIYAHNKSGGTVAPGDILILDTANSTATEVAFTTTTSQDNKLVLGMALENMASDSYGEVQIKGPTALLKVDGTADISVGNYISTFTTVKIGASATAGKGGAFAIALEAYTTNDSSGVIDAWLTGGAARIDTASQSADYASPTLSGTVSITGAAGFNATAIITCTGAAAGTDTIDVELGDITITDGKLNVTDSDGTTAVCTIACTTGIMASDVGLLVIDSDGDLASGANMVRLDPTGGTPNAGAILFEIVGAAMTSQSMYIDGDSTGVDVVHINGGGVLTNGFAVLGLTNDGNLATGGAILNLTAGGASDAAARMLELDGTAEDILGIFVDVDTATGHMCQLHCGGNTANDKAVLAVTSDGTMVAGSSLVRIECSTTTGGATVYGLEIACNATNLEGLMVSAGKSVFTEDVTILTTSKLYFTDTSQYIYASADNSLNLVAPTLFHIDGPTSFGETGGSNAHDVTFYCVTNLSTIIVDEDQDALVFNGTDLWLKDNDILSFGDGAAKAGDWNIASDGTDLTLAVVGAAATFNMGATSHLCNVLMGSTSKIQFLDTGLYINSPSNGKMEISADGGGADDILLDGGITVDTGHNIVMTSGNLTLSEGEIAATSTAGTYALSVTMDKTTATNPVVLFKQDSTTAAKSVVAITQDDVSEAFITFSSGDSGTGVEHAVRTNAPTGTARYVKIEIESTEYWVLATAEA